MSTQNDTGKVLLQGQIMVMFSCDKAFLSDVLQPSVLCKLDFTFLTWSNRRPVINDGHKFE